MMAISELIQGLKIAAKRVLHVSPVDKLRCAFLFATTRRQKQRQSGALPFDVNDIEAATKFALDVTTAPRHVDICDYLACGTSVQLDHIEQALSDATRKARSEADEESADKFIVALDMIRLCRTSGVDVGNYIGWKRRRAIAGVLWMACGTPERCVWVLKRYGDVLANTNCFKVTREKYLSDGLECNPARLIYLDSVLSRAELESPEEAVAGAGPMPSEENDVLMADFLFDAQLRLAVRAMAETMGNGVESLKKVIWERRDIILSNYGEERLGDYLEAAMKAQSSSIEYFRLLEEVTFQCREVGVEATFGEALV